jgi:hypothetical protein
MDPVRSNLTKRFMIVNGRCGSGIVTRSVAIKKPIIFVTM